MKFLEALIILTIFLMELRHLTKKKYTDRDWPLWVILELFMLVMSLGYWVCAVWWLFDVWTAPAGILLLLFSVLALRLRRSEPREEEYRGVWEEHRLTRLRIDAAVSLLCLIWVSLVRLGVLG